MNKFAFAGAGVALAFAVGLGPVMAAGTAAPDAAPQSVHRPMIPYYNPDGTLRRFRGTVTTASWSGYAVTAAAPYSSNTATWQVPDVAYDGGKTPYGYEYVLNWAGIGGDGDATLIQLGTESWVSTAGAKYFAVWYELYPAVSQWVALTVKAGDIVTASLLCTANCTPSQAQTWQLTFTNNTTGAVWTQSFQYQSSMASAEWITEPPYYNGYLPLADYQQVTFDPVAANGANPNLSLSANGLIMIGSWGQTSNPSAPVNGDTFSTCWGAGTLTPCTAGSFTTPPPTVTASLTANPASISPGQSSTLTWSSTNATTCTGNNFTASGISGSTTVYPSVTTSYGVTCTDAGGDPATAMATVTVTSSTGGHRKKH